MRIRLLFESLYESHRQFKFSSTVLKSEIENPPCSSTYKYIYVCKTHRFKSLLKFELATLHSEKTIPLSTKLLLEVLAFKEIYLKTLRSINESLCVRKYTSHEFEVRKFLVGTNIISKFSKIYIRNIAILFSSHVLKYVWVRSRMLFKTYSKERILKQYSEEILSTEYTCQWKGP